MTWPHRLVVRTPGFHPGNRGSIPRGVTTKPFIEQMGVFVYIIFLAVQLFKFKC